MVQSGLWEPNKLGGHLSTGGTPESNRNTEGVCTKGRGSQTWESRQAGKGGYLRGWAAWPREP